MHPNTRALVASAAYGLLSDDGNVSAVFDYAQGRYLQIGGTAREGNVSLFDYGRNCHFSGSAGNLFDYGRNCHVSLQMNGSSFTGFDYGDGHHFSGTVNGNAVSLYDYGSSSYFQYSA